MTLKCVDFIRVVVSWGEVRVVACRLSLPTFSVCLCHVVITSKDKIPKKTKTTTSRKSCVNLNHDFSVAIHFLDDISEQIRDVGTESAV